MYEMLKTINSEHLKLRKMLDVKDKELERLREENQKYVEKLKYISNIL